MAFNFKTSDEKITLHPDPHVREYQIHEMTSSEYWKFLMQYGRRKMTKPEWEIRHGKKKREERQRYEFYIETKFG